jgi:hypothetical protein
LLRQFGRLFTDGDTTLGCWLGDVHGDGHHANRQGVNMDDHLQRALIEIYYAMAEFRQAPSREKTDVTGARLIAIMANLEEIILVRQQAIARHRAA